MTMAAETLMSDRLLSVLLDDLAAVAPEADREIQGLCLDSRTARAGDLFLACAGGRGHGLDFVDQAVAAGVAAVAWEPVPGHDEASVERAVPAIAVPDLSARLGLIADRFYHEPSRDLFVAGITGTNGKTSCSRFLAQALDVPDAPCGVIGTLGYGIGTDLVPTGYTTPDAVAVHGLLDDLRGRGAKRVAMEVSSHALHQGRVNAVRFDLALWTNLSRDHLDYHGDMEAYAEAKARLFAVPGLRFAVVNLDDDYGRRLWQALPAGVEAVGYGLDVETSDADARVVRGHDPRFTQEGFSLRVTSPWGEGELRAGLLGRFNAGNLLGVLAALLVMGVPLAEALRRLAAVHTVPGRMERFGGGDKPLAVVDYAHTPDALEQALTALREHCRGKLWCVFGAGGERDTGKRPAMGAAAERLADRVVLTDDNPRGDDPTQIVVDILAGIRNPDATYIRRDRGEAIAFALGHARADDVVLVAGKGHEDYQEVRGRRLAFSDRELVARLLGEGRS